MAIKKIDCLAYCVEVYFSPPLGVYNYEVLNGLIERKVVGKFFWWLDYNLGQHSIEVKEGEACPEFNIIFHPDIRVEEIERPGCFKLICGKNIWAGLSQKI